MLDSIVKIQSEYISGKSDQERKAFGQFFTGAEVADYMASLVSIPGKGKIRILDAGAGAGILTAACVSRCIDLGCEEIHAVLFEIDVSANPYIEKVMQLTSQAIGSDVKFTYEIVNQDFVLSRPDKDLEIEPFDVSVINPPYFKYNSKHSPYSDATLDLYKGNPNIYASFMAVVIACLKEGGQMVVIAPRSFTNGLYFKWFRLFLIEVASLEHIHIFVSRDKVFKDSKVLQENIICKYAKTAQSPEVQISSSRCNADIQNSLVSTYTKDLVIDSSNGERIIRIPESPDEAKLLLRAQQFGSTFSESGYFISTGPVVGFRTREYISNEFANNNSVPLMRPHNVKPLQAIWSGGKTKDARFWLESDSEKHLIDNRIYVLLKRFSSKDEKRRLVAAVHNPETIQGKLIGFDNKINYLGVKDDVLSLTEAFGLASIFNSTFMDKYFRCLSGNTQVNATEIRVLRFPPRKLVKEIGKKIKGYKKPDQAVIDKTVHAVLEVCNYV